MIVVADTTPLRYLILIGRQDLLHLLYGQVFVPPAVADELSQENTPADVRDWMVTHPSWLEIRCPIHHLDLELDLDAGELEAIALAEELKADLLW